MQVLRYIEDSFNSFNLRMKIELFILPLLILLTLIFFTTKPITQKSISNNSNILNRMQKLQMQEKIVNIITNIENYANINSLKIKSMSSSNKSIKIEVLANKKEQIKFMKFLEDYNNFSKIKTLLINQKSLNIELSFKKIYLKEKLDLRNRIEELQERKNINLKLQAIIGKKVLINNKWLEVNKTFNEYEIVKINRNSVFLHDGFEIIELKIYNENI